MSVGVARVESPLKVAKKKVQYAGPYRLLETVGTYVVGFLKRVSQHKGRNGDGEVGHRSQQR